MCERTSIQLLDITLSFFNCCKVYGDLKGLLFLSDGYTENGYWTEAIVFLMVFSFLFNILSLLKGICEIDFGVTEAVLSFTSCFLLILSFASFYLDLDVLKKSSTVNNYVLDEDCSVEFLLVLLKLLFACCIDKLQHRGARFY